MKILLILLWLIQIQVYGKNEKLNILVIQSFDSSSPWSRDVIKGLENINKLYDYDINYYVENLDFIRLGNSIKPEFWENHIINKYKTVKIDGVFLDANYAAIVFDSFNSSFLENVPRVYNERTNLLTEENFLTLNFKRKESVSKTIDLALSLHPNLKKIYVIEGNFQDTVDIKKILPLKLKKYPNIEYKSINNYTFTELKRKIKSFEKDSIVIFNVVSEDREKNFTIPMYFLQELIYSNPNLPMYSFVSSFLGTGIVGGHMLEGSKNAETSIRALVHYHKNGNFGVNDNYMTTFVDWSAIKKYNIDPSNIPKWVTIINKPRSILETHFYESLFVFIVFLMLLSFILILIEINKKLKNERKEKLKKDEIIISQRKNALIGEMISIIAHQWRQPLNRINSNISVIKFLKEKLRIENKDIEKRLNNIEKQTLYMSETIDDFSDFLSPSNIKKEFFLSNCIDKALSLLMTRIKEVETTLVYDSTILLYSYENQISQIVISILDNALDNFIIKEVKNPKIRIETYKKNKETYIKITDNGKGIDEKILSKIFDAHFSTKTKKSSNGLGLYLSKNIAINLLEGDLYCYNEKGGAVFEVKIPFLEI